MWSTNNRHVSAAAIRRSTTFRRTRCSCQTLSNNGATFPPSICPCSTGLAGAMAATARSRWPCPCPQGSYHSNATRPSTSFTSTLAKKITASRPCSIHDCPVVARDHRLELGMGATSIFPRSPQIQIQIQCSIDGTYPCRGIR